MTDYWVKRALERLRRAELLADNYEARIFRLYQESFEELNGELKALFQHYAEQGSLTSLEAAEYLRAPVTREQAEVIMQKLAEIEDPDVRRRLLARANSAQVSARMKRIQAMQENIKAECAKIADKEIAIHQEAARKLGTDAYYRSAFDTQQGVNAAIPFAQMTIEKIDAVLSERWAGENYSSRVWQNAEVMAQKLGELIRTNVVSGRPWEQCIDEMQQYMASPDQGGYYAATRLLRTETMHVYNEMSAEASRSMGARRYRFIAVLDLKTSETCRRHDGLMDPDTGKYYTYAKRKAGVNFPPLHPWCRSIEAPYISKETLKDMTRPARNPVTGEIVQVPATMTYNEWYKEYVEGDEQAVLNERMIKNTSGDREQWQRYREVLGKNAPKDLAAFQRIKYTDSASWADAKRSYRDTISVNRVLAEPLQIDAGQFGKKVGKHASDFGLDASSVSDREEVTKIIHGIVDNYDTVSKGAWRGQQSEVLFFTKAEDVVVTNQQKAFITILKGGTNNARVKNSRRIRILPIL